MPPGVGCSYTCIRITCLRVLETRQQSTSGHELDSASLGWTVKMHERKHMGENITKNVIYD